MRNGVNLCVALIAIMVGACTTQRNEWQDLNYSSVYRRAKLRELDAFYTPPADMGCMSGDSNLYNCH